MKPVNKRIIAVPLELDLPPKSKLILPNEQQRQDLYTVVWAPDNEQGIKAGDDILINRYEGIEREINGAKYHFIHCDNVLAILD